MFNGFLHVLYVLFFVLREHFWHSLLCQSKLNNGMTRMRPDYPPDFNRTAHPGPIYQCWNPTVQKAIDTSELIFPFLPRTRKERANEIHERRRGDQDAAFLPPRRRRRRVSQTQSSLIFSHPSVASRHRSVAASPHPTSLTLFRCVLELERWPYIMRCSWSFLQVAALGVDS